MVATSRNPKKTTKKAPPSVANRLPRGAARQMILDWLAANGGEVVDKSGRATTLLHDRSGYQGSMGGLAALLQAMETEGIIVRSVSGRRCSRIALARVPVRLEAVEESSPADEETGGLGMVPLGPVGFEGSVDIDPRYDELAWSLLRTVSEILQSTAGSSVPDLQQRLALATEYVDHAKHEITSLERQLTEQRRELSDDLRAMKSERDGLRQRLRRAEDNNSVLMGQLQKRQSAPRDGKALAKLMREVPAARG